MRLIFTLLFLILSLFAFAQPEQKKEPDLLKGLQGKVPGVVIVKVVSKNDSVPKGSTRITMCGGGRSTFDLEAQPLIVIDGMPYDYNLAFTGNKYGSGLANLDPNDIESFDILKDSSAYGFYGNRPDRGLIIITTKSSKFRKFIIKDFLDGSRIAGATVSFISADKKDTIMMVANDSGVVVTDKLKGSVNYEMPVSATGYKLQAQRFKISYDKKEQEVLLEREIKICKEVIITSYGHCHGCRGGYSCTRVSKCSLQSMADTAISFSYNPDPFIFKPAAPGIFPNPAQKGKAITVETTSQSGGPLEIKLTSLDGRLLFSRPQKAVKGLNRFIVNTDPRWSAGIYFVQLYENGKILASNKVIIQ